MASTSSRQIYIDLFILLVLSILFFLPVIIHSEDLISPSYSPFSDLTVIHWPNAHQLASEHEAYGQIPLWKNVSLSGMPAIANQLAMLYYPPNFLFLGLPINLVFNLFTIGHVLLSGLGLYLFLRLGLERSRPASLISAVLYMFSGKLLAHVAGGHVSLVAALAWLPWAFLGVNWAIARRSLTASILTGVLLTLQLVTHSQIVIYTAYILVLYAAFELWWAARDTGTDPWRAILRRLPTLLPILVVPLLLGAVQILPLLELAPYSNRAFTLTEASAYSLSIPQLLLGLFLPDARAGHEFTIYPGLVTLGLAGLAVPLYRERRATFFFVLACLLLLLSLGTTGLLFPVMYWLAPGWRWMRAAARAWLFLSLTLAVLASYGFDGLLLGYPNQKNGRWRALAGVAIAFVCLLLGGGLIVVYGQVSRATIALALLPLIGLGVVWLNRLGRLSPFILICVILLLGLADLWSFDRSLLVFKTNDQVFSERADVARYLSERKKEEDPFRLYSPSYSVPQHVAALHGLELVDGVEPVHLVRYDKFMAVAGGYGDDRFSVTIPRFPEGKRLDEGLQGTVPNTQWLGLLNARYVVADFPLQAEGLTLVTMIGQARIYRNERALPRAFAVSKVRTVSDGQAAWESLPKLDLSREAVVEDRSSDAGDGEDAAPVKAEVVLYSPNKIVTEVDLATPSLLVLSEMWYPGWTAYDNGRPVPILRTDFILRGVQLEAGHHSVAWVYQPSSLRWGLRITSVGAFLTALALVFMALQRAQRTGSRR